MEILINLIAGAVGGNLAGGLLRNLNQGTLINSVAGIVGGGLGGQILGLLGAAAPAADAAAGGLDLGTLVSQIAGGGIGGGVALAIVGAVRKGLGR